MDKTQLHSDQQPSSHVWTSAVCDSVLAMESKIILYCEGMWEEAAIGQLDTVLPRPDGRAYENLIQAPHVPERAVPSRIDPFGSESCGSSCDAGCRAPMAGPRLDHGYDTIRYGTVHASPAEFCLLLTRKTVHRSMSPNMSIPVCSTPSGAAHARTDLMM